MSLQNQTQILSQAINQTNTLVVGGFDVHGSSTATVIARALKIPFENLVAKYPDTSPELLPKFLYSQNLFGKQIFVVDIGVNVKNPNDFINTMKIISDNNTITFIDHHETNYPFLPMLPTNIRFLQFSSATTMAKAVAEMFGARADWDLLLVGAIGDRDSNIREAVDVDSMYFEKLYKLANVMDVLVRKNLPETLRGVYMEGASYLEKQADNIKYQPNEIANELINSKKVAINGKILLVDATEIPQNMSMWIWKTFDELLRRYNADYLVAPARVLDRQLNQLVNVVFVVKFWLSEMASPKQLIAQIGNRKVIGHDTAFSISATSQQDAQQLANDIINSLAENYSITASYIPTSNVAKALQNDFRRIMDRQTEILQKLAEILQLQQENYAKYNQLKEEQINMLRRVTNTDVHRAD